MKLQKLLYLSCILMAVVSSTFAIGTYTNIESGITLHSIYYPNIGSKFKGTIVFENGSGTDISEWSQNKTFFKCAQQAGPIFLYDRNGLGKSPADLKLSENNPITGNLVSTKLLKLLKKRKINPPYIIVAHSYGAMYAGNFTLRNPKLVKGVLFVDPVPKIFNFSTELMNNYESAISLAIIEDPSTVYKKIGGQRAEVTYQLIGFEQSKREVAKLGNIDNKIPIVIISSTKMERDKPLKEDWYSSQKQWLNNNSKSKIITVNSGHFIQLEQPETVCSQIKTLTNYTQ